MLLLETSKGKSQAYWDQLLTFLGRCSTYLVGSSELRALAVPTHHPLARFPVFHTISNGKISLRRSRTGYPLLVRVHH